MQLKPIFLWGYMGAGKSRLGKRLSTAMSLDFIDLDNKIEQEFDLTVTKIFQELGEEEFRKKEHALIKELSKQTNIIISCGGGAPCFYDNKNLMLNSGSVIYLTVAHDELLDRLWKNKDSRPIISQQQNQSSLCQFVEDHLNQRMPFYAQAHLIYDNTYPKTDLEPLIKWIHEFNS